MSCLESLLFITEPFFAFWLITWPSTLFIYEKEPIPPLTRRWSFDPRLVNENSMAIISLGVNMKLQPGQCDRNLGFSWNYLIRWKFLSLSTVDIWLTKHFPFFLFPYMPFSVLLNSTSSQFNYHKNNGGGVTFVCKGNKLKL